MNTGGINVYFLSLTLITPEVEKPLAFRISGMSTLNKFPLPVHGFYLIEQSNPIDSLRSEGDELGLLGLGQSQGVPLGRVNWNNSKTQHMNVSGAMVTPRW